MKLGFAPLYGITGFWIEIVIISDFGLFESLQRKSQGFIVAP